MTQAASYNPKLQLDFKVIRKGARSRMAQNLPSAIHASRVAPYRSLAPGHAAAVVRGANGSAAQRSAERAIAPCRRGGSSDHWSAVGVCSFGIMADRSL